MKTLAALIETRRIVLSDGAWGTEIAKRGLDSSTAPELFNVDQPGIIREIARSYAAAGADVILTNTFGGNARKLARYGLGARIRELNEAGVRLSREGAADDALVIASLGPTGDFLEPLGDVTEAGMVEAFAEQIRAFAAAGADAVVVETMTDLGEAKCALKAARDNSDLEVICSMTFDKGARGFATMMGVTPRQAAEELERAGADVIGANCGSGIGQMVELTALLAGATRLPVWVKPNAGIPELVGGSTVFRETPDEMAARIPDLVKAGATFVGGCCGTTPAHIGAFRKTIDRMLGF